MARTIDDHLIISLKQLRRLGFFHSWRKSKELAFSGFGAPSFTIEVEVNLLAEGNEYLKIGFPGGPYRFFELSKCRSRLSTGGIYWKIDSAYGRVWKLYMLRCGTWVTRRELSTTRYYSQTYDRRYLPGILKARGNKNRELLEDERRNQVFYGDRITKRGKKYLQ